MKIAIVSDAIYPYNKGGKEKRIYEISTRLAKKGFDVHIYCMKWWKGKENSRIENGVHLHAICRYYPLYIGKTRSIKQGILFGLSCIKLIREDFDIIDVDNMVFFHLFPIKLVCILKGKIMIVTWNEVWGKDYWLNYLGWKGIFGYLVEKFSILTPNKIISISKHTTDKLRSGFRIKKKIYTIPMGVDFEKIQQIKPAKEKSDVIFAGRLLSHKNIDVLIKSILLIKEKYQNIRCFIIGDGPEKQKLKALTGELKLQNNIRFLSFFENQNNVYSLIKSSKVFILPSTREGFGIVVIEANACGIPVITIQHKNNAAKDLIEEGKNGFICQPNKEEIVGKTIRILNENSNNKMKQTCIDSARKYDWDKIVNELKKVYSI